MLRFLALGESEKLKCFSDAQERKFLTRRRLRFGASHKQHGTNTGSTRA